MPAIALKVENSAGHGCFDPTPSKGPYATTSFFNGKAIQLTNVTLYEPHTCGLITHSGRQRLVVGGSSTCFFEGNPVARINDAIACGDKIGQGSPDTFIGG